MLNKNQSEHCHGSESGLRSQDIAEDTNPRHGEIAPRGPERGHGAHKDIPDGCKPVEAFVMPSEALRALLEIVFSRKSEDISEAELFWLAADYLESIGWRIGYGPTQKQLRSREPLRQLAGLLDLYSGHHLTMQAVDIVRYAFMWCENSFCPSGYSDGNASYPRISLELVNIGENSAPAR